MNLKSDVKPEHAFYCADGSVLKNLSELAGRLKVMSGEVYASHVNSVKNDFRNWLRDVYGDSALGERIASAKGRFHAAGIIEAAISKRHVKRRKSSLKAQASAKVKAVKKVRKPKKRKSYKKGGNIRKSLKLLARRYGLL